MVGQKTGLGGAHPPLQFCLFVTLFFTTTISCKFYQIYLRHLWLKFYISQISGWWFPWHPKGGCTPPINLEVFFSDILATATRLNTLYGLETWYVQSPRRVLITKKVLRHIRSIYDVINVGFFQMSKVSFVALTFANGGVRKN